MQTKDNIDKRLEATSDNSEKEKLIKLASKDPEVLEFDFLNEVVDTLREDFLNDTKDNPMSFNDWLDSKPDSYFKRFSYGNGGKVIDFLSYAKMKEPKIKKLDLAQGDFDKALVDIKSESDRAMIKELLRRSGINVGKE